MLLMQISPLLYHISDTRNRVYPDFASCVALLCDLRCSDRSSSAIISIASTLPSEERMNSENAAKLRMHTLLSVLTFLIGLALMIMMIVVEDELGALPLGLIVLGSGWYFVTRRRARAGRE